MYNLLLEGDARNMKASVAIRSAIGFCAAFTIVACAGSQLPINAPHTMLERTSTRYTLLHSFGTSGDGETPFAGLIKVGDKLYGTTLLGGTGSAPWGTAFSITTSGKERVLHSFDFGSGDGQQPYGTLVNVKGILYGTTWNGGTLGDGTVFSITRSGKESVLHSFGTTGEDGLEPYAGLLYKGGALYGTTSRGGGSDDGVVFSITPSGKESVLYSFAGTPDGAEPYGGLTDVSGTLYGTTQYGGDANGEGTVFSITTSGKETALHSFGPYFYGDGEEPYANLLDIHGTLYGTTHRGGAYNDGAVFTVTTSGKEAVLYSFGASTEDGQEPNAGLINVNGTFYGTTSMGGANGKGTVFAITQAGSETVLHSFGGTGDGISPQAALLNVKGRLYGTTEQGGSNGDGTIFAIAP